MTLTEYAEVIGRNIEIRYIPRIHSELQYANIGLGINRFVTDFENAEIGEDGILRGAFGTGVTPEQSMADYARQISGKRLIFNAYDDKRRVEALVPALKEGI